MKKCPECYSKIYLDDYLVCPYCGYSLVPNSVNNVCVNIYEVEQLLKQHNIHKQVLPFIYAILHEGTHNENSNQ